MMNIIQTKSFQVAANISGDEDAEKLAILMPGRLDTKDYVNFMSHAEFLADLGFLVVAIDPPGTWESPGDLEDYTTSMYVQCVNELIAHFGNRPTLLLGHSRGGATAMIASENPAVAGLILVNAAYGNPSKLDPSKIIDGKLAESRDLPPGNVRTEEQRKFDLPMAYFEDGKKHDPISSLSVFAGPKLIVHATEDEFVSLERVQEIYETLKNPKTFLEINCKHDYRLCPEAITQVNNALTGLVRNELWLDL
jgi:pimeloyl-ACP methyl ester carboxylesterase